MLYQLTNKHALVGGSSRGIGRASAIQLAALGADVTLMARTEADLIAVLNTLDTSQGQQHGYIIADYTQREAMAQQVAALVAQKPVHILINNTGGPPGGPAHKAGIAEFLTAFENHLICNHLLVQTVLESMKSTGYGRIINIISTSVKQPLDNLGVSNTIRGAVASWAKTLANELGQWNITVNNVLPGATRTERLSSIASQNAAKKGISVDEAFHEMESEVPLRRIGKPEEIAAAVAFLASPAASYVSGINLPVDGGRTKSL